MTYLQSLRLVGAVGIEFSKPRNRKELCGSRCNRKSFVVYTRNCRCPRIAPSFDAQSHAVFLSGKIIRTTLLFASRSAGDTVCV